MDAKKFVAAQAGLIAWALDKKDNDAFAAIEAWRASKPEDWEPWRTLFASGQLRARFKRAADDGFYGRPPTALGRKTLH
jgi:hypothetical protein